MADLYFITGEDGEPEFVNSVDQVPGGILMRDVERNRAALLVYLNDEYKIVPAGECGFMSVRKGDVS